VAGNWILTGNCKEIKSLFLEDDEVVMGDRLSITEKSAVKIYEIKKYIDKAKAKKLIAN